MSLGFAGEEANLNDKCSLAWPRGIDFILDQKLTSLESSKPREVLLGQWACRGLESYALTIGHTHAGADKPWVYLAMLPCLPRPRALDHRNRSLLKALTMPGWWYTPLISALRRQKQAEFEASLVHRASSRSARATQRNPVSKKPKTQNKQQQTNKQTNTQIPLTKSESPGLERWLSG